MGVFLSTILLEKFVQKNIVFERLWLKDNNDGLTKQLVFDSAVPDDQSVDVILTNGKGKISDLYVVGSSRTTHAKKEKIFTYAPFQRNSDTNIDKDVANEIFKALKGQSETIKMSDTDRQQFIDRGAQLVNERLGDIFKHDITHVVVAPSSSPLAKDFASACMKYIDKKDPEKFFPFKLSKIVPDAYQKTADLNKIHISPDFFDYTLKNIIEKEPEISLDDAKSRAQMNVDNAEKMLRSHKNMIINAQKEWDKNSKNNSNKTKRPVFTVSDIPQQYRRWTDGIVEPVDNDKLKTSSPKIVVVIDDNVDTGHTVFEIANHLYEMGADKVVGVALYKFRLQHRTPYVKVPEKSKIDHSDKFWSKPTKTWTLENCILAKNWLLSMLGKAEKLKLKVPPFDFGFKEKFTGDEERKIHFIDQRIAELRLASGLRAGTNNVWEPMNAPKVKKESVIQDAIRMIIRENKTLPPWETIKTNNLHIVFGNLMGYEVGKMINSGAIGFVFSAREISTGKDVALKFSKYPDEWKGYAAAKAAHDLLPDNLAKHIVKIYHASQIKSVDAIKKAYPEIIQHEFGDYSVIIMEKLKPLGRDLQTYYFRPDLFFQTFDEVHEVFKKSLMYVYQNMQYDMTLEFLPKSDRIKFLHEMMNALAKNKNAIEKLMYERTKDQRRGPTDIAVEKRKDILHKQLKEWTSATLQPIIQKWNSQERAETICLKISYKLLEEIMYNRQIIRRPSFEQKEVDTDDAIGHQFYELAKSIEALGFQYDDLHEDNLLIRPGTDDLVFADVGQFGYRYS